VLTDLSRAVVLHYLGPVLSTVLARVVLRERVSPADALSLGACFAGMVLAADLLGGGRPAGTEEDLLGTVLGVASGVLYGAALLCYRFRTDMPHWGWAGALFLISGLLALGMLVVAGAHLRAAELSGLPFTEVVVATVLGALVLAEPFGPAAATGSALILVAAVAPLLRGARSQPA
jgi:drug/metabolite transporter (DMT)-like permease